MAKYFVKKQEEKSMSSTKRIAAGLLAVVMAVMLFAPGASAAGFTRTRTYTPGQFTDVAENAWYASSVKDVYELGLMSGTGTNTFSPNGMFTVAEALTVAGRMYNIYNGGNGTIPGTTGDWQKDALNYCVGNGIVQKGRFDNYYRNATRAEMAEIMASALPDSAWNAINSVTKLPDVSSSTEGHQAIFKLYNAGVFGGSDDYGSFQPYASITRAEVAAIVARCADPGQRLTLNLKPLSDQRVEFNYDGNSKMSNGRIRFRDSETKLYGYMDGAGNIAIKATYSDAKVFSNGYAPVYLNGNWGLINTSGQLTVAASYLSMEDKGYGVFEARDSNGRAIVVNGAIKTACDYTEIKTNGVYIFARCKTSSSYAYDVFDMSGTKLGHFDGYIESKTGSPLLAVQSGNKWALAVGSRAVTDYVYDSIELYENATLALVKTGSMKGLGSESGIVPGCDLGEHTNYYSINGGYALTWDDEAEKHVVVDVTGWTSDLFESVLSWGSARVEDNSNKGVVFAYGYGMKVIDTKTGKVYTPVEQYHDNEKVKYALMEDGTCYLGDGTLCTEFTLRGDGDACATFRVNGKYGLVHKAESFDDQMVVQPIYNTPEEAINAYGYYKIDRENGKPVVVYGNEATGFSADRGVHYYQNGIYYDEIQDLGEGYYACRFNTTWYLIHA